MELVRIRIDGPVTPRRALALGCAVTAAGDGDDILEFSLTDQAALYGVLAELRDAGLGLISVERIRPPASHHAPKERSDDIERTSGT